MHEIGEQHSSFSKATFSAGDEEGNELDVEDPYFWVKNDEFVFNMMDFALKMMDFALKMMDLALKMMDFAGAEASGALVMGRSVFISK